MVTRSFYRLAHRSSQVKTKLCRHLLITLRYKTRSPLETATFG